MSVKSAVTILIVLATGAAALAPTAGAGPTRLAEHAYNCDVGQGFNFQKDSQALVCHIDYLKIGGIELRSDLSVTNPTDPRNPKKVFGVGQTMYWHGGYADPIQFVAQVSDGNKRALATLLHQALSNTEVELAFTVYDYDPEQKKYYPAFHTDGQRLKGLVQKRGGELVISLDPDQGQEVVIPRNYSFTLSAMPQDEAQEIHVAVSESDGFTKRFGITVGSD
jgi:hypothetical protein